MVTRIVFDSSNTLFGGFADGDVRMWDLSSNDPSKRLKAEWKAHTSHITGLVVHNGQLTAASRDQTATVFDLTTLKKLKTVPLFEAVESFHLAVSVDDAEVYASAGEEGTLKLWNLTSGRTVKTAKLVSSAVEQLLVCRARSQYLVVTADHNLLLVDAHTLHAVKQFVGFNDEILDVALVGSEEERESCLLVATNSPELRLYNRSDWSCQLISGVYLCHL